MLVRAATLTNYQAVARRHGLNAIPLLRDAGLSRAIIDHPDQMIPAASVVSLLDASAKASGCESFALQMSEGRGIADFGPVSLLIAHQPTLRDALETLIHFRHLINPTLSMRIESHGEICIVREELALASRQASELLLAVLLRFFRAILGEEWTPNSVGFVHTPPKDASDHRSIFGCALEFNSASSSIVCDRADLDRPNRQANAAFATHARQFIEMQSSAPRSTLADEVRQAIILLLPSGSASIQTVAQTLGFPVRTLQRRLDHEGVKFSGLLDDVRRELVQRYLDNAGFRMLHIAEMLGYATPAAFTRWFLRMFGETPSAYRHRLHSKK